MSITWSQSVENSRVCTVECFNKIFQVHFCSASFRLLFSFLACILWVPKFCGCSLFRPSFIELGLSDNSYFNSNIIECKPFSARNMTYFSFYIIKQNCIPGFWLNQWLIKEQWQKHSLYQRGKNKLTSGKRLNISVYSVQYDTGKF